MENLIKEVVSKFNEAIATRNVSQLETILHQDFVVMANRFKGDSGMTVMSRAVYLGAMSANKIGGTLYDVEFINISTFEHTAMAEVLLDSKETASMHVFLSLVKNSDDHWQIICNLPVIVNN